MESLAAFRLTFERQLYFLLVTRNRTLRLERLVAFELTINGPLFFFLVLVEGETLSLGKLLTFGLTFEELERFLVVFTFAHDQL